MTLEERAYALPAESLLARAAAGDTDAFDAILSTRLDGLYATAVVILRHEQDAFDAVQDACLRAWRELRRLRDADRFDAWLGRILVNTCRDRLRSRRRATVREIGVDDLGRREPTTHGTALADRSADLDTVRRAFLRLKPDERILLALHHADHRSVEEIAELMAMPVGTVKWRLHEARKSLARALEREQ